ncbi:hypothetical protein IKP13_06040, partial [bacterium]|nr:hypothetical protein [bacterium]
MMIMGGFFLEFRFFFLRCKILFMGSIVLYIKCICFSSKIKQIGTKNCNSLSGRSIHRAEPLTEMKKKYQRIAAPFGTVFLWRHLPRSNQLRLRLSPPAGGSLHRNGKTVNSTHAGAARRTRLCTTAGWEFRYVILALYLPVTGDFAVVAEHSQNAVFP